MSSAAGCGWAAPEFETLSPPHRGRTRSPACRGVVEHAERVTFRRPLSKCEEAETSDSRSATTSIAVHRKEPLLAMILIVLALAAGACRCGGNECSPATCHGGRCCDSAGECSASSALACGSDGQMCSECQPGDQCINGYCRPPCTPETCSGCCTREAGCTPNQADRSCFGTPASCLSCSGGQICPVGECPTDGCYGCVTDGGCEPGTSKSACGLTGLACAVCDDDQVCFDGACIAASPCSPTNCRGCCQGEVCIDASRDDACGLGGATCLDCNSGDQRCDHGACAPRPFSTNDLPCSDRCENGCCDSSGVCVTGDQKAACGVRGTECSACGFACIFHVCF